VISTWRSVENWQAWLISPERKALHREIDELLPTPTQYSIYLLGEF